MSNYISNKILHRVEHYLKHDGSMEQSRTSVVILTGYIYG